MILKTIIKCRHGNKKSHRDSFIEMKTKRAIEICNTIYRVNFKKPKRYATYLLKSVETKNNKDE